MALPDFFLLNVNIKLLVDFQSIRNQHDLSQISVPDKFKEYGDFHKYYTGEMIAPITTIFIGGNEIDYVSYEKLFRKS